MRWPPPGQRRPGEWARQALALRSGHSGFKWRCVEPVDHFIAPQAQLQLFRRLVHLQLSSADCRVTVFHPLRPWPRTFELLVPIGNGTVYTIQSIMNSRTRPAASPHTLKRRKRSRQCVELETREARLDSRMHFCTRKRKQTCFCLLI